MPVVRPTWRIACALFAGYFAYTLARQAVVVVADALHEEFGLNDAAVGSILSSFAATYGVSKFASALVVEMLPARALFSIGLVIAAIANLVFVVRGDALTLLCVCWGLNGAANGLGWPALSKILITWFPSQARGTVWGILSTSGGMASALSPLLLSAVLTAAHHQPHPWHWVFLVPAAVAAVMAVASYGMIPAGSPADLELKPESKVAAPGLSKVQVLKSWQLWALVLADGLVFFVLKGISNWCMRWLQDVYGASHSTAALGVTAFEAGGVAGTLFAGHLSDMLGGAGYRHTTSLIHSILLLIPLHGIVVLGAGASCAMLQGLLFTVGFAVYGPKTVCGIAVREDFEAIMGPAAALLGLVGQLGAVLAGYPLGLLNIHLGWGSVLASLLAAAWLKTALFAGLHYAASSQRRLDHKKTT